MFSPNPIHSPCPRRTLRLLFLPALALVLLFLGLTMWLANGTAGNPDPEEAERAEWRIKTLAALRAEEAKRLESYAWVDRAKGRVQIPVSAAMEIVTSEINDTPPRPAYPVATPADLLPKK